MQLKADIETFSRFDYMSASAHVFLVQTALAAYEINIIIIIQKLFNFIIRFQTSQDIFKVNAGHDFIFLIS